MSAGTLRHQLQNDRKSLLQAYQRKHGHRRSPKRNVTELIAIPCTDVFLFVVYLFRWLSMTLGVSILIHHSMECAWSWWMRKWCQMNTPSVVYMHDIIIVKIWGRRTIFFNSPINISMVKVELLTLIFFLGSLTLRLTARAFSQLAQKKSVLLNLSWIVKKMY